MEIKWRLSFIQKASSRKERGIVDYGKAVNYTLVAELQKALNESNERINELEKMWNELKILIVDKAHFYESKGYMHQGAILVDVVEVIEQLEKENDK